MDREWTRGGKSYRESSASLRKHTDSRLRTDDAEVGTNVRAAFCELCAIVWGRLDARLGVGSVIW